MRIFVLLPLLIVLGGCSKSPVVETESEGKQQQEVKEEVHPEELVAKDKPAEAVSVNPNLKYQIKGDAVTITGCDKRASGELIIPDTIEGNPVTSIGDWAFDSCTSLTSITIGKGVTSIGFQAFEDCPSLTSITIGKGVTSIGLQAFIDCPSLTTIEVGAGNVNYTGVNGVLFNKEKTTLYTYPRGKTGANYTIPDSVTSIGESAFNDCKSLTSITIPDGVTSIGEYAFSHCPSLTSIIIPDGVISIGEYAFQCCSSLTTIEVGAGNVNYTGVNGVLFNKEKTVVLTYPVGKTGANYKIPEGVTSIGQAAFYDCRSLTSITIPDSVTSIGARAFGECISLTGITIPDSVTSIGNFAFAECTSLTSITIPDSVTSIENGTFRFCRGLTSITIPDSVTSIGLSVFFECANLTAVTFLGDAPKEGKEVFEDVTPTIYRKPEAKGWGDTFAGRPVKLISEKP